MFAHVHVVNGVMLVHSHPSKSQHTHTEGQILTLAQISTFVGLENSQPLLGEVDFPLIGKLDEIVSHASYGIGFSQHIYLRAPPVGHF